MRFKGRFLTFFINQLFTQTDSLAIHVFHFVRKWKGNYETDTVEPNFNS